MQPPADRLAYFAAKVVAHPRLVDAHRAVHDALHQPTAASLIVLYGPTGVGKTTLRLRLEQQLITEALPAMEKDTARVPVLAVEAIAPESGQFNWKDYYARALVALNEPLLDRKVMVNAAVNPDAVRPTIRRSASAPALRWVLEQCLRQRRVGVCLIDEAQHLKRLASGRRLLDQMDTLKSPAATTGTMHVLIGTYELLGLTNLSAQLSRRSVEVHFGRYRATVDMDRLAFKSVLLTFQRHLPVSEEPDLVGLWERLYEGSLGCVGVLKSWLNRALADAIAHEATTITRRHLDRQALPTRTLLNLAREITEGEAVLRDAPCGRKNSREARARIKPRDIGPHGFAALDGSPAGQLAIWWPWRWAEHKHRRSRDFAGVDTHAGGDATAQPAVLTRAHRNRYSANRKPHQLHQPSRRGA